MGYDSEKLLRIRHLLGMGGAILDVTDRVAARVKKLENERTIIDSNTTAYWNGMLTYIPPDGAIIIYTDFASVDDKDVPNFKIGDGKAYLIDLPFAGDDMREAFASHLLNKAIHLSQTDRDKLTGSVTASVSEQSSGDYTLVLTE